MLDDFHNATPKESSNACEALHKKIDLFMQSHVLTVASPGKIHWWFSLSGGKDSYAMAEGIRQWYAQNHINLVATAFTINQWDGPAHDSIAKQIAWADVIIIDARKLTMEATGYRYGDQAPCRVCADVRRNITDSLVMSTSTKGFVNIIARGLHLSDTATSIAWRHVMGLEPSQHLFSQNKGLPLAPIFKDIYIAKPLYYVREFESATFAASNRFQPSCCGCPGCMFPSRRDIVEESVLLFFDEPIWEMQVPGIRPLLSKVGPGKILHYVEACSAPGSYTKSPHLPSDFHDFAICRYRSILSQGRKLLLESFDPNVSLDDIGKSWILGNSIQKIGARIPMPMIIADSPKLTQAQKMMAATIGPFWGAIGLAPPMREKAWKIQREIFGFSANHQWTQVIPFLKGYYDEKYCRGDKSPNVIAKKFCSMPQGFNGSKNAGVK